MNQAKLSAIDGALAVLGVLALVWTFLPWWTWNEYFNPTDHPTLTVNAWDQANSGDMLSVSGAQSVNGPLAWMPMILLLLLGIAALLRTGMPQLLPGRLFYQVCAAAGFLGALLVIIRWASLWKPDGWESDYSSGAISAGIGLYLGLITALGFVLAAIAGIRRPPGPAQVQAPPQWPYPYPGPPPQGWGPPIPPGYQSPGQTGPAGTSEPPPTSENEV